MRRERLGCAPGPYDGSDDDAHDGDIVGVCIDANGLVLRICAFGLELHGVRPGALVALQRDLLPDARDHDIAISGLWLMSHRDDVAGGEPHLVE